MRDGSWSCKNTGVSTQLLDCVCCSRSILGRLHCSTSRGHDAYVRALVSCELSEARTVSQHPRIRQTNQTHEEDMVKRAKKAKKTAKATKKVAKKTKKMKK